MYSDSHGWKMADSPRLPIDMGSALSWSAIHVPNTAGIGAGTDTSVPLRLSGC
jgi:hypothetical protein